MAEQNASNNENSKETLLLVHQELSEEISLQEKALSALYNKANWLMATDFAIIALILAEKIGNGLLIQMTILCALISFVSAIVHVFPVNFSRGPSVEDFIPVQEIDTCIFLREINKKKKEVFDKNKIVLMKLASHLKRSAIFLLLSVLLLSIQFLTTLMKDPNNSGSQQQTSGSAADPVSSVFPSAPEVHQLGAQPSSTNIKPITERISKTKF